MSSSLLDDDTACATCVIQHHPGPPSCHFFHYSYSPLFPLSSAGLCFSGDLLLAPLLCFCRHSPCCAAAPLVSMSQSPERRRSARSRAPLRTLADDQARDHFHRQEQVEVLRALRESTATVEVSDSEESEMSAGEVSGSDDDEKTQPNDENTPQ